jgi:putative exporter of polyketide antibiotics
VSEANGDLDSGAVVEERWVTVLVTALVAAVLIWWRHRGRPARPSG